jgi:hypothetical protein
MLTDRPPITAVLRARFLESDRLTALEVPEDDRLQASANSIDSAMLRSNASSVRQACTEFLSIASGFYLVRQPGIRVLAARPLRVREGGSAIELFGDYDPETLLIRLWMRTAIRKQVTSYGTFLSTLCHEFCHHLDCQRFGWRESCHTRGFYQRTAALYHHARGTPVKPLFWVRAPGERWRIDWPPTNRGA